MINHASPAAPIDPEWIHRCGPTTCGMVTQQVGAETHAYRRGDVCVLSSAELAEYQGLVCPHNHVSVSVLRDGRPSDAELHWVRHAFDMLDAEEDNHQPGRIRNLFLPLHLPRGTVGVCDCKEDEEQVTEADGFVWSRKR